jgi:hypothetical protein
MSTTVFTSRIFGGRDVVVTYDNSANTITILGRSVTISSLSAALQSRWNAAIAGAASTMNIGGNPPMSNGSIIAGESSSRPSFGGDGIGQIIGAVADSQPTWRVAVQAALAGVVATNEAFSR